MIISLVATSLVSFSSAAEAEPTLEQGSSGEQLFV